MRVASKTEATLCGQKLFRPENAVTKGGFGRWAKTDDRFGFYDLLQFFVTEMGCVDQTPVLVNWQVVVEKLHGAFSIRFNASVDLSGLLCYVNMNRDCSFNISGMIDHL